MKTQNFIPFKGIYKHCGPEIRQYEQASESKAYQACTFKVNGLKVMSRLAKITPTKTGQFVTSWQRNKAGITEPFPEDHAIDFLLIQVNNNDQSGQFIFPKTILIAKGILSSSKKDGKRGFRVYPPWNQPNSKQAQQTQAWQTDYFVALSPKLNDKKLLALFGF